MELEPRSLVGHHGVAHRVGLVEGIVGEIVNLVVDGLGHVLRDAVCHAAGDVPLQVPVEERLPLLFNIFGFLLAHGPADHVRLPQGIARQLAEDLNDLLLVDNTAIGVGQNRLQRRVLVGDQGRILGAGQKFGDGVHGAGTVQGDNGADILNALGLEAHAHPCHPRRFHLEHPGGLPLGQHLINRHIVIRDILQPEVRLLLLHHFHRIVQHSQVAQAQKVHFQQAQLLNGGHGVLGDRLAVVGGQGDVLIHRALGDHHPGGVGGGVAGHPLDLPGHVHQLLDPLVPVVEVPQARGQHQRLVQGHLNIKGHLLGDIVHLGIGEVEHPPHVADGGLGLHGAEGDDLHHMVLAVLPSDVLDDLPSPGVAEVHVDIRHAHPLRV